MAANSLEELSVEDLDALDEDESGGVSKLEYIKFMLVAMNKCEPALFDNLQAQFDRLDVVGDGRITKKDLTLRAKRRLKSVSKKLELSAYKVSTVNVQAFKCWHDLTRRLRSCAEKALSSSQQEEKCRGISVYSFNDSALYTRNPVNSAM